MIEISDQSVLYLGILMYIIFMIATYLEFRKMRMNSESNAMEKKRDK